MIRLTRLNRMPIYLNSDLIEHIDPTPDTVVSLTSGQKFMVQESPDEICEKVLAFRRSIVERDLRSPRLMIPETAQPDATHGG